MTKQDVIEGIIYTYENIKNFICRYLRFDDSAIKALIHRGHIWSVWLGFITSYLTRYGFNVTSNDKKHITSIDWLKEVLVSSGR